MNATEKLITLCRVEIGDELTATDKQIDNAIALYQSACPQADIEAVKKFLLSQYNVPMELPKTLYDSNNPGAGWYSANNFAKKDEIQWRFWNRYASYLRQVECYKPGVIYQLDKLTDDILDNLFDPREEISGCAKKGLVVGQVQSGKTSNFTGLICKAVDAGFNVIIVFAGILDDLRTQTQERLESCFLGFTTKDIQKIKDSEKIGIGVGLLDKSPIAHAFTTVLSDFKESTVNSLGTNFYTQEPILFVVKKNGRILGNLKKWLSKKNLSSKSVLFIDDEADNASVNTAKDKRKASSINKKIRDILNLFNKNAYVGYTATPYANIFIDRENAEDLFPRHFIVNLPTPPAYLSPEKVFGIDNDDDQPLPIVNIVNDYKTFVPDKHKKDEIDSLTYDNLPESLKYAIRSFILACAVRIARGQGNKHNSMLIHLSRFQIWQNTIKEIIERIFNFYKSEIFSDDADIYEQFRKDYEETFVLNGDTRKLEYKSFVETTDEIIDCKHNVIKAGIQPVSWNDVKNNLYKVVDKIEVKALNGASADVLAYSDHKDDGYYVIAIGGDKLSRGLTLEGLTISYFLRASKMYDTLMQMGRWFGYRPGYVDVCRLFVSEEINNWFKDITIANNELRADFDYLWESKGSPQQFAMKVRTSPGLLITSPLKMFSTKDVQVSWSSTLVETYSLVREKKSIEHNFRLTSRFIRSLGERYLIDGKDDNQGFLWTHIPVDKITNFISKFRIAETSRIKLNFEKMVEYIQSCVNNHGELKSWRVLVRNTTNPKGGSFPYSFDADNIPSGTCTNRTRVGIPDQDDQLYNLKNYHLISGPDDEFIDMHILNEEAQYLDPALEETRQMKAAMHAKDSHVKLWEHNYPSPTLVRQKYRPSDKPLLIIYPLNPIKANIYTDKESKMLKDGIEQYAENSLPFISFAIVFPQSKTSTGVKYKVNDVIKSLIETELNFDKENDNIYPDEQ
ncbi:Z1 domain-containing protein [uncultured Duncaniella sp.]|uniref:Z1 domain-containing protein n=1 Tax=uncultured Duncaniella sp. TaxID=2768039 RepID=UPI000A6E6938|nr:Z1 domain-containing protein [uncultured Duncaniella sp.]